MSRTVLAVAAVVGMTASAPAATQVHYVMGTFLRIDAVAAAPPGALEACFTEARALDRTFSRFDPASELVRLNAAGGGAASERFRRVLAAAMRLRAATAGAFDVSVGALTALWRDPGSPDAAAIAAARDTVGRLALRGDRVVLGPGTVLDFDGFAKGVAVDACVSVLRRAGVSRALVSFGESSLYALGAPPGADAWRLDVRGTDPTGVVARLALRDQAAAVSAVFGEHGPGPAGCGHVVDPRSGRCLDEAAVSLVVGPSAADAEAHAKLVLVGGDAGIAAAEAAGQRAARLTPDGVRLGEAMRASGRLRVLARPRSVAGEVGFR